MRAAEPELLQSNGAHRPQPTLVSFLDCPMGRVDASQLVHARHKALAAFFPRNKDTNVHRPRFWACSKPQNALFSISCYSLLDHNILTDLRVLFVTISAYRAAYIAVSILNGWCLKNTASSLGCCSVIQNFISSMIVHICFAAYFNFSSLPFMEQRASNVKCLEM